MKITLTAAPELENAGKYNKLVVKYEASGRDSSKTLVSFGDDKPAFDVLRAASEGQTYEVTSVTKGKYSNWTNAVKLEGEELPPSRPRKSHTEGEDDRQIRIMRQSCLSSAANFHNGRGGEVAEAAVLATAAIFFAWVVQPIVPTNEVTTTNSSIDEVI